MYTDCMKIVKHVHNMYIQFMYIYYQCTGNVYTKPLRLQIVYTYIHWMCMYRQYTYKYKTCICNVYTCIY